MIYSLERKPKPKSAEQLHDHLKKFFKLTDLGDLSYFLGLEVQRNEGNYSLTLKGYIEKLAEKFGMINAKGARTPMETGYIKTTEGTKALENSVNYRSLIGALLYVATNARPDIAACVSILGRKLSSPTEADWTAAKRVVRYLLATKDFKLHYGRPQDLIVYSDADFAGDVSTRKSTTGFLFLKAGSKREKGEALVIKTEQFQYSEILKAIRSYAKLVDLEADMHRVRRGRGSLKCDKERNGAVYKSLTEGDLDKGVEALTAEATLKVKNLDEVTEAVEVVTAATV
ncbi:uncharacterized protein LOC134289179 [Aedes albopictus]|uniref:Reverse transcriptase Ty1/copia-type domain-containing protein n=1 Tax=Aedes albopictus TaxID=7160 RepID=A0ABM1YHP4_AEDAL